MKSGDIAEWNGLLSFREVCGPIPAETGKDKLCSVHPDPTLAHRIFLSPSCLAAVGMGKVVGSGQGEEAEVVGGPDSEQKGSLEGERAGELEKGDPSSRHCSSVRKSP